MKDTVSDRDLGAISDNSIQSQKSDINSLKNTLKNNFQVDFLKNMIGLKSADWQRAKDFMRHCQPTLNVLMSYYKTYFFNCVERANYGKYENKSYANTAKKNFDERVNVALDRYAEKGDCGPLV